MLTKFDRRKAPIPHEPEEWLELRQLPWLILEAAKEAKLRHQVDIRRMVGKDIISELQDEAKDTVLAAPVPEAEPDPTAQYDQAIVLKAGIVGWSYEEEFAPELIDDLDPATAEWAFKEILKPAHRTEAEREDRFFRPAPSTGGGA